MSKLEETLTPETLGFDPKVLADRYQQERDRRVRSDAESQFVEVTTDSPFANKYLEDDPYSKLEDRAPITDCLLYTSPSPRDATLSRMPSSA